MTQFLMWSTSEFVLVGFLTSAGLFEHKSLKWKIMEENGGNEEFLKQMGREKGIICIYY